MNNPDKGRISVVVCTYNGEQRLPASLRAISRASARHKVCEVIIVDNASNDDTHKVVLDWQPEMADVPVRYIHESRRGTGYARERGIREHLGDLLCFIDDDNEVFEDYFERAVQHFSKEPHLGLLGGASELPYAVEVEWFSDFARFFAVGQQFSTNRLLRGSDTLWGAGLVLRSSALKQLLDSGWRLAMSGRVGRKSLVAGEDGELVLAMRLLGWEARYDEKLCLYHRIEKSRLTTEHLLRLAAAKGREADSLEIYKAAMGEIGSGTDDAGKSGSAQTTLRAFLLEMARTSTARGIGVLLRHDRKLQLHRRHRFVEAQSRVRARLAGSSSVEQARHNVRRILASRALTQTRHDLQAVTTNADR